MSDEKQKSNNKQRHITFDGNLFGVKIRQSILFVWQKGEI